jgi:opacity protein-like surface antigen
MRAVVGLFVCGLAAHADAQSGAPATPWEGPFGGIHLGPGFQSSELGNTTESVLQLSGVNIIGRGVVIVPATTTVAPGTRPTDHSFIAGLEGGWDHRRGDWMTGFIADLDFGGQSSSTSFSTLLPATALTPITSIGTSRKVESGVSLSFRARGGYVWNDTLIYGTGGLALTRLSMSAVGTWVSPGGLAAPDESPAGITANLGALGPSTTVVSEESLMKPGWTLGLGAERYVIPTISVGVEYRYTRLASATFDLGDRNTTLQGTLTGNTTTTAATAFTVPSVQPGATDVKFRDHRVLVRATWRFDLR